MSRSAELLRFLGQLRITDLIDFVIVWAIVYGLLKLVRGTRAVVVTPVGRAQLKKVFNLRWEEHSS